MLATWTLNFKAGFVIVLRGDMASKLAECFGILIDMLQEAFNSTMSESQYHEVLKCIKLYIGAQGGFSPFDKRKLANEESQQLLARGWPLDYDLASQACKLRDACTFGKII